MDVCLQASLQANSHRHRYKNRGEHQVFHTLGAFFLFQNKRSLGKMQETHILVRREIVYRMVYEAWKKIFLLELWFPCTLLLKILSFSNIWLGDVFD